MKLVNLAALSYNVIETFLLDQPSSEQIAMMGSNKHAGLKTVQEATSLATE